MTFHSGSTGTATIGASPTEIPVIDWHVHASAKLAEFVNSRSAGFVLREPTIKDASVDFSIDFDYDQNPFQTPLNLYVGQTVTNAKLFLTGGTGGTKFWTFTSLVIDG